MKVFSPTDKQDGQRHLAGRAARAIRNPVGAIRHVLKRFARRELDTFVAAEPNRSDAELTGSYVRFVEMAVRDYRIFRTFKRHPDYRVVLEHVSQQDGAAYLKIISTEAPALLSNIEEFKENDLIGDPIVFEYGAFGRISPTTLRYVKVASDLKKLFGDLSALRIAEIGIGYGGQFLILDRLHRMGQYDLFDLPPVLELASKYLEGHILNSCYRPLTLNRTGNDTQYDLVISNYAFSELPAPLQVKYIEKIIGRAKRGYLTMNSGYDSAARTGNKLQLAQLQELLPAFEILEERPSSGPDNYIIVWGHNPSTG
jgi:hypothetical protein